MADALAALGQTTEATLLAAGDGRHLVQEGPWAGRTAHVGSRLPAGQGGDLWLDTCELSLMVLLPRDEAELSLLPPGPRARLTPFVAWMSLQPVARWQFGAFLDLARWEPVWQPKPPPFPFLDPARILDGPESGAVTRITCHEAGLYAFWFGKGMTSQEEWEEAARYLPQSLWSEPACEWAGSSSFDDEVFVAVSPETVNVDPRETDDEENAHPRMLYGNYVAPDDITFRTSVSTQYGLSLVQSGTDPWIMPGRLLERFSRS